MDKAPKHGDLIPYDVLPKRVTDVDAQGLLPMLDGPPGRRLYFRPPASGIGIFDIVEVTDGAEPELLRLWALPMVGEVTETSDG